MKEKITIPFYNDLLFKYFVYDNEDEGCQYILKKIIEEITPIRCKELYVINSELMTCLRCCMMHLIIRMKSI